MKKVLMGLIMIVCLGICCYSAYQLLGYYMETEKTKAGLEGLSEMVGDLPETDFGEMTAEEKAAAMMAKYGELYEKNHDLIGWLHIDDTGIDYPVMYTPDEPQYYLRKNFDGEYDIAGMLFADERCSLNPEYGISMNVIIYGHRMKNSTMFGDLGKYKEEAYVEDHKLIRFDTLYEPGTYEVFAVILSKAYDDDEDTFKYYDLIEAEDENAFVQVLENLEGMALYYDYDAEPVFGDRLLTLSTCDYYTQDGRLAVIAKRVGD